MATDGRFDRALIEAALAVNAAPTLEAGFHALTEHARTLLGSDIASVVVWDDEVRTGTVRSRAGHGGDLGEPIERGNPVWQAASTGQPTITERRTSIAKGYSEELARSLKSLVSSISVPIVAGGLAPVTLQAAWRAQRTRAELEAAVDVLATLAALTRIVFRTHVETARALQRAQLDAVVRKRFLERLFDALPVPVGVADPETREVLTVNRAFLELVGEPAERVVGTRPPHPWSADDSAGEAKLPLPQGTERVAMALRHSSGRVIPVEMTRLLIEDGAEQPAAIVGIVTDLSERRRFEQQLVQGGKLAAIGELAAGVAHEINNPLFAILGLTEFLLEDAAPGSKQRERLEIIRTTGLEIKDIVRSLLDFARERSDEHATVSLTEVARQTVELFRRTSAAKQIEIVERYTDEPTLVHASANQLKQIFVNLFSNARQAMPEGGTITVEVDREGDAVVARVADTGAGMSEDALERIFEPFYTTRRDTGGTGLGLSVSLGIARSHGGTLTVESRVGEGARFVVSLPLVESTQ